MAVKKVNTRKTNGIARNGVAVTSEAEVARTNGTERTAVVNIIPFVFPDFSNAGDKRINLLIVGPRFREIEDEIKSNATDDEELPGSFNMIVKPSLVYGSTLHSSAWPKEDPIHFIIILIPVNEPNALTTASDELRYIDPLFVARKRVVLCMVRKNYSAGSANVNSKVTCQFTLNRLQAFVRTVGVDFQNIHHEDEESVSYGSRILYNKMKRMLIHPTIV